MLYYKSNETAVPATANGIRNVHPKQRPVDAAVVLGDLRVGWACHWIDRLLASLQTRGADLGRPTPWYPRTHVMENAR